MKDYTKIYQRPKDQGMIMISKAIKRQFKLQRVLRGSEDGFTSSAFHRKCDNIGSTLTLIQSENGKVFGGFTMVPWGVVKGKNG